MTEEARKKFEEWFNGQYISATPSCYKLMELAFLAGHAEGRREGVWTRERPTVPGVYWVYISGGTHGLAATVAQYEGSLCWLGKPIDGPYFDGTQWIGPLPPPAPPEETPS